jgi:K+-sensing histidine kinase KdpD
MQILDEAKMEFLKRISHELRTPLNGIRGFSELIALKCKSDETDHLLNRLFDSIDSLYDFSTMALDITSLRLNKYKINPEVYDIREDINTALEGIHDLIREKNITLRKETLENVIEISVEKDLIKRSIRILLENAVKHTAENSSINIRYLKDDQPHLFSILDNGPGFHESILKSDLSAFNTGNKHLNKNMGLNLPFANLVFLGHNGYLKIDNHPEGGAMVQFSLPVAVN